MASKPGLQRRSITRRVTTLATVGLVLVCTELRSQIRFKSGDQVRPSTPLRAGWREASEYVDLLAPAAHKAAYRAYVAPSDLDETLVQVRADPGALQPPGAWAPQSQIPYDAFGLSGSYNRWKVAGLYRSRRARVARGPRVDQGQMESWTLIAPYPDVHLQRFEPGTLILVLRIPSREEP